MKIKTIRFKNINSLRNEHTIDFTRPPLDKAGLFAITGKTGSGKSTLLDVISLALYNQIPRLPQRITKTVIESTGTILTRNTQEAYAEVVYECREGEYLSRWSISTNRKGKLRDYEMELSNNQTKELLDLNKSDVPGKNEKLVGLSYKQFISSILLAQGDFAKFLQAGRTDRGELLEKITGSWIYREIGIKAFKQAKNHKEEQEKKEEREDQIKQRLMNDDDYKQAQEDYEAKRKRIKDSEKRQKELEQAIKQKDQIQEAYEFYQKALKKEQKATTRFEEFDKAHGAKLEQHKNLIPYAEDLQQWKQLNDRLQKHRDKHDKYQKALTNAGEEARKAHQAIESFIGEEVERQELIPALEKHEQSVTKLSRQIEDFQNQYRYLENSAKSLQEGLDETIDIKKPTEARTKLQEAKSAKQERRQELTGTLEFEYLENPVQSMQNLKNYTEIAGKWKKDAEWVAFYNNKIKEIEENIVNQKEKQKTFPEKIDKAKKKEETLRLELENLRKQQQINQLTAKYEEQRQKLEAGQPCPLCGSKEHPYVEQYAPSTDDLSEQINEKQGEHKKALSHVQKLQADEKNLKENIGKEQKELEEQKKARKEKEDQVKKCIQQLPEAYHSFEPGNLKDHLLTRQQQLEEFNTISEQLKKMDDLHPVLEKLDKITKEGKQRREELEKIYTGNNIQKDVKKLRDGLNQAEYDLKTAQKELEQWEKDKASLQLDMEEQEKKLQPVLDTLQYPSIREAMNQLLSSGKYEQLKEQREEINSSITSAQTEKKTYENQHRKLKEQDVNETKDELVKKRNEFSQFIGELNDQRGELYRKISNQKQYLEELDTLQKEMEEQKKRNEKWLLLNRYIGDATGNSFSTFAQQLTLEQLVHLANKRITSLSERYVLDIPAENEDESLVIKDMDMGAQRRSVKTLSGGESFLISLSLALALSDLASRNVDIQSLFIDEGFGSLDQVTLDQTLDTLEKLQAESEKTIGVISHIEALKERMDTQIEIVQNGQGFSSVEVKSHALKK